MKSRFICAVIACSLLLPPVSSPAAAICTRSCDSGGNPTAAIIIGGVAIAGAVWAVHFFTHRSITVTGCVKSVNGTKTLVNEKDQRSYLLVGSAADAVEFGSRVTLKGKGEKGSDGAGTLKVEATLASHGTCAPSEPPGPEPRG
jgi:hypothetical protein